PRNAVSTSNPCLSISESAPTIQSALVQWKTARTFLSSTIRSYLTVCATLRASYATLVYQSNEQDTVKEALATICTELESLASEERLLYDTRVSLAAVISNSVTLPNVNRLPPEILASIFGLSRAHCTRDHGHQTNGPTSVCRYWRRTALDAAHLWTHIDIGPDIPSGRAKLLLDRSKHAPVHIHVLASRLEQGENEPNGYESEHLAESMMVVLAPHIYRICTLNVESSGNRGNFVFALLNSWSYHDTANSLLSLRMERTVYASALFLPGQDRTPESLGRMLLALTSLRLDRTMFGWDSNAYRGLVDLQLVFSNRDTLLSMMDLASIIAASPDLTTLKLYGLDIQGGWIPLAPIVMRSLEFVSIVDLEQDAAASVLSLITLPGPRAELGITLSQASTLDSRLADFFARSTITTLYHTSYDCEYDCDGCLNKLECEGGSFKPSRFFPQYLPHIQTLILDGFILDGSRVNHPNPPTLPPPLQPQLQNLVLLNCRIDFEVLRRLVHEIGVQSLRFERRATNSHRGGTDQPLQELQTILGSLQRLYPQLQCQISYFDSTERLECRTSFLYG
ncbi:hypothetical protein FRC09_003041, partial [Ceratobasidium sp. 395]